MSVAGSTLALSSPLVAIRTGRPVIPSTLLVPISGGSDPDRMGPSGSVEHVGSHSETDSRPMLPVIGLRLAEGRSGSTLLIQLLATSDEIVFDSRYPAEYRFVSYFARMASMMSEPFDEARHVGVTPFFFGERPQWGPVPFATEVVDISRLSGPILRHLWQAWTEEARRSAPHAKLYAEKLAVSVSTIAEAGIPVRVIDLVRDPRDVLPSIRAFTAGGIDGFGRRSGVDEGEYLEIFIERYVAAITEMAAPTPRGVERIEVRYEDLVLNLGSEATRLGKWAGVVLDPSAVEANRDSYEHHMTSQTAARSVGRWRRDLTPREADVIAERLADHMRPYGYELD